MDSFFDWIDNSGILDGFDSAFEFVYQFIFSTAFPLVLDAGQYAFDTTYSFLSPYIFNGQFFVFLLGFILFVPVLNLIINILRG